MNLAYNTATHPSPLRQRIEERTSSVGYARQLQGSSSRYRTTSDLQREIQSRELTGIQKRLQERANSPNPAYHRSMFKTDTAHDRASSPVRTDPRSYHTERLYERRGGSPTRVAAPGWTSPMGALPVSPSVMTSPMSALINSPNTESSPNRLLHDISNSAEPARMRATASPKRYASPIHDIAAECLRQQRQLSPNPTRRECSPSPTRRASNGPNLEPRLMRSPLARRPTDLSHLKICHSESAFIEAQKHFHGIYQQVHLSMESIDEKLNRLFNGETGDVTSSLTPPAPLPRADSEF